jgi:hypothetical protein
LIFRQIIPGGEMNTTARIIRKQSENVNIEIVSCKRKKGYPLKSLAERDLASMIRETGDDLNLYDCGYCGKIHIGHKSKEVFEFARKDLCKDYIDIGNESLVNIRHEDSFYIFKVPKKSASLTSPEIVEVGELVSVKDGYAPYIGHGGIRSRQWQVFTAMAFRPLHDFMGIEQSLDAKRQTMGRLDCILVVQAENKPTVALAVTSPAAMVQKKDVMAELKMPEEIQLERNLLKKIYDAALESGSSDDYFRGYVRGLIESSNCCIDGIAA